MRCERSLQNGVDQLTFPELWSLLAEVERGPDECALSHHHADCSRCAGGGIPFALELQVGLIELPGCERRRGELSTGGDHVFDQSRLAGRIAHIEHQQALAVGGGWPWRPAFDYELWPLPAER